MLLIPELSVSRAMVLLSPASPGVSHARTAPGARHSTKPNFAPDMGANLGLVMRVVANLGLVMPVGANHLLASIRPGRASLPVQLHTF